MKRAYKTWSSWKNAWVTKIWSRALEANDQKGGSVTMFDAIVWWKLNGRTALCFQVSKG